MVTRRTRALRSLRRSWRRGAHVGELEDGVADAVVEDAVTGRTPLELKTGKGHVDHEAQAALYVAMLRGLDSNWARGSHGKAGLLVRYGAKDPKPLVTSVRCSRRELTTLLAARNVVAAAEAAL